MRHKRQILIVPPLFDEMNRVRRVLASAMRSLTERGVGSALIDLPGCNESLVRLEEQDLAIWRAAVLACAEQLGATHIASLRGGALIDDLPAFAALAAGPGQGRFASENHGPHADCGREGGGAWSPAKPTYWRWRRHRAD